MGLRACTFSALRTFRIRSMIMLLMQVNLHNVEIRRRVIMPKIAVSLRLEPEFVSLLKKIAKEEYGSDSKKGYVVENAISLYHSQRLRPTEAASILSVTSSMG